MKGTKYTLTIKIEALSMDSIPAMLRDIEESLDAEVHTGSATFDDGDCIKWETHKEQVSF